MKIVEPDTGRSLMIAAAGWTPGTNGKVTGNVVILNVRTKDDLKTYKGKLKDAVDPDAAARERRPGHRPPTSADRRPKEEPKTAPKPAEGRVQEHR